jgi:hypothetical protein
MCARIQYKFIHIKSSLFSDFLIARASRRVAQPFYASDAVHVQFFEYYHVLFGKHHDSREKERKTKFKDFCRRQSSFRTIIILSPRTRNLRNSRSAAFCRGLYTRASYVKYDIKKRLRIRKCVRRRTPRWPSAPVSRHVFYFLILPVVRCTRIICIRVSHVQESRWDHGVLLYTDRRSKKKKKITYVPYVP